MSAAVCSNVHLSSASGLLFERVPGIWNVSESAHDRQLARVQTLLSSGADERQTRLRSARERIYEPVFRYPEQTSAC